MSKRNDAKYESMECPRCGGTREEPGAPIEPHGGMWLCGRCKGRGYIRRKKTMRKNTNCLEGYRCSVCKQEDEILVWAKVCVSLTDDGTDAYADSTKHCSEVEYDGASDAQCPSCDYTGRLTTFEIKNQKRRKK